MVEVNASQQLVLVSHRGTRIVGTLEQVSGVAVIGEVRSVDDFDYSGDTKIWWDGQITIQRDGLTVFVDEEGDEYTANEVSAVLEPTE